MAIYKTVFNDYNSNKAVAGLKLEDSYFIKRGIFTT